MIVGNLKEIARYKGISKNIDTAIDFVLNNDLINLPIGKSEIDGKKRLLYASKLHMQGY